MTVPALMSTLLRSSLPDSFERVAKFDTFNDLGRHNDQGCILSHLSSCPALLPFCGSITVRPKIPLTRRFQKWSILLINSLASGLLAIAPPVVTDISGFNEAGMKTKAKKLPASLRKTPDTWLIAFVAGYAIFSLATGNTFPGIPNPETLPRHFITNHGDDSVLDPPEQRMEWWWPAIFMALPMAAKAKKHKPEAPA